MTSRPAMFDAAEVLGYIGQTVLLESVWDDEPETHWQCLHIVGAVVPMTGVYGQAYFLTFDVAGHSRYPNEVFLDNIRTIRVIRNRDRHGSGNVLGRITLPNLTVSGAALPARRNSYIVPANGSTGAAHP